MHVHIKYVLISLVNNANVLQCTCNRQHNPIRAPYMSCIIVSMRSMITCTLHAFYISFNNDLFSCISGAIKESHTHVTLIHWRFHLPLATNCEVTWKSAPCFLIKPAFPRRHCAVAASRRTKSEEMEMLAIDTCSL